MNEWKQVHHSAREKHPLVLIFVQIVAAKALGIYELIKLRDVEWVHCLFLFSPVLGKT